MMRFLKQLKDEENGTALILSLIFLVFGSITLVPLLNFTATEMVTTSMYKEKTFELYTCDAAIEDAAYKLIKMTSPLDTLEIGDSYTYTTDVINNRTAEVTITKISLLSGIIGDDEYKVDRPHETWISLGLPPEETTRNETENWVEYQCQLDFDYQSTGDRYIQSIGVFFAPYPGEIFTGPYDEAATPVITFTNLESQEQKIGAGGFSFIYRWQKNVGPLFNSDNQTGSLSFKFRVDNSEWMPDMIFAWATVKEQDISYIANMELTKWTIEAVVDNTILTTEAIREPDGIDVLSWELSHS